MVVPSNDETKLPWRIEAFREYLTFESLQPAASVLSLYEGEVFTTRNPRILEMQDLLAKRTKKDAWIPKRSGSADIEWNLEGDVTRNKGRVFTSMLILHPKEWKDEKVALTEFGRALGRGLVNKERYYDFIVTRFRYPHPAWPDNWTAWTNANKVLYPFVYLLAALIELHRQSPASAYLTTAEVADYLHPDPDHSRVTAFVSSIVSARENSVGPITPRSDDIHRKISDILGFMCLTRYCYFDGSVVRLNLLDMHHKDKSNFWEDRRNQSKLQPMQALIRETLA
jgi:hypothetical protein